MTVLRNALRDTRIIFFGTPAFGVPALRQLAEEYTVVAAVTQQDKPVGRKRVLTTSPIKQAAQQLGIPVLQPTSLRATTNDGKQFREQIRELQPDLCIVIAYGKIIPEDVLHLSRLGFLNVHASLLPQLRGASPIQAAILAGLKTSGVTIMLMNAGMDTGPLLASAEISIHPRETFQTLHDALQQLGTTLLLKTLPAFIHSEIQPEPQPEHGITMCSLIHKEDGLVQWKNAPEQIDRQIRALNPWPGTYTYCNNKRVKILAAHCEQSNSGSTRLIIDTVQPEGKKAMTYSAFRSGYPECELPPAPTQS